ncbi:hypothetical protein CR155_10340 [Pollutimonas nitritireducens]|uniref:Large ribosomal RNA subunit accumulation protein YceD n=1 Tax=Pollutimonas nitritireducens TaxID=2045209 RepID=A0A2N4UFN9_9BURK|nr:DUF177 domain-containing protein [Pollutimonas nitritireducens]PLC53834.1 hypothetical protein CR155_10340 [Pollutimonas nitritireducens]
MDIQYVDTYELTRAGHEIRGQAPIDQFERLIEDLPDQTDTMVSWTIKGEMDSFGQRFLHVHVVAAPLLECQRCLKPLEWAVDSQNRLQVVNSEAALNVDDGTDADPDDAIERILGSQRLDVLALVEDEIILSLPYVPKHDVCPSLPEPLEEEPESDAVRPSPFAVLDQLKKN